MDRKTAHLMVADLGEKKAAARLGDLGYNVRRISGSCPYDLLINGCTMIEIKTALPTKGSNGNRQRWQFEVDRPGHKITQDLLILVCLAGLDETDQVWYYVVPSVILPTLRKIDITSKPPAYKGRWSLFLGAWALADLVIHEREHSGIRIDPDVQEEIPF